MANFLVLIAGHLYQPPKLEFAYFTPGNIGKNVSFLLLNSYRSTSQIGTNQPVFTIGHTTVHTEPDTATLSTHVTL